jgi:hypothetical protein
MRDGLSKSLEFLTKAPRRYYVSEIPLTKFAGDFRAPRAARLREIKVPIPVATSSNVPGSGTGVTCCSVGGSFGPPSGGSSGVCVTIRGGNVRTIGG